MNAYRYRWIIIIIFPIFSSFFRGFHMKLGKRGHYSNGSVCVRCELCVPVFIYFIDSNNINWI